MVERDRNALPDRSYRALDCEGQPPSSPGSLPTRLDAAGADCAAAPTRDDSRPTRRESGDAMWRWVEGRLAIFIRWLRANTFVPDWVPAPWRQARTGYLIAGLAQALGTLSTLLLVDRIPAVPHYGALNALDFLTICLIALSWGAGPSLIATFMGASLLTLVGLVAPQPFVIPHRSSGLFDVCLFVAVGLIVTIAAGRTERARRDATEHYLQERELAASLYEINERTDTFLSLVTHELKTPLASMGLAAEMARRRLARLATSWDGEGATTSKAAPEEWGGDGGAAREDQAERAAAVRAAEGCLDTIQRQIRLQTRLIDDLLDVARIQSGQLELRLGPCDLEQIVRQAVEDQRLLWPGRALLLGGLLAVGPPGATGAMGGAGAVDSRAIPIVGDADRLGQVVTNFLTNALKYSPLDRPVWVALELEEGRARASVRDAGPGLSAAERARIWQRFYRVAGVEEKGTRHGGTQGGGIQGGGLGLGLYICKTIVERHGGAVGVQSRPGEGATFFFDLPLLPRSAPAVPATTTLARASAGETGREVEPHETWAEQPASRR